MSTKTICDVCGEKLEKQAPVPLCQEETKIGSVDNPQTFYSIKMEEMGPDFTEILTILYEDICDVCLMKMYYNSEDLKRHFAGMKDKIRSEIKQILEGTSGQKADMDKAIEADPVMRAIPALMDQKLTETREGIIKDNMEMVKEHNERVAKLQDKERKNKKERKVKKKNKKALPVRPAKKDGE